ncbi:MAG TPA: TonB-dependent receptor, partial [Longimicrobiales bacterium]|nr:TonB-dependent receptor [Longimicrobiales bacterium]
SGADGGLVVSHELDASVGYGAAALHLAHRSSFSPPGLADQFFRAGVGVEPNPDLRAERVPSEVEAGISASVEERRWSARASLTAYRGDVRDMIVWSPDYRFVWSPRNVDVHRRGLDASLEWRGRLGPGSLEVSSSWSIARVTGDAEGRRDLQLRYRPRHAATVGASYRDGRHAAALEARYVGSRLPVPAEVNRLPGFWTLDLTASTGFGVGGWRIEPALRVDRLLDARDSMIFAFPEPGRTVSVELAVARRPAPPSTR